jgi:hypothetical protein
MPLLPLTRAWPYAAILAWPLLAWAAAWAQGFILAPGDGWGQYLPQRIAAATALQAGVWPFWNPFQFGGMPLLAVSQTGVFFPGNWGFLLLPTGHAMNVAVLLAYWVAGFSCWAYARAIQLPHAAAVLCAWVFMGCGSLVANMEHLTVIQAAGLIPALFWAVERYVQTRGVEYARWLALLVALQIFAGYPQTVLITALLLVPYTLWRFSNGSSFDVQGLLRLGGAGLLGLGISTLQWLPTVDLLTASDRHTMSYAALTEDSWPLREVPTLVFPFLYGNLPNDLFTVPFWGKGPWRNELMGYAGLLTLVLAGIGAFRARRNPLAAYWVAAGGLAAILALGAQTPLYKIWHALPIFGMVRVPARHLLEVDLALAILAGLGFGQLLEAFNTRRRQLVTLASLVFALLFTAVAALVFVPRSEWASKWQAYAPVGVDVYTALAPTQAWFWVQALFALGTLAGLSALVRWPDRRGISAILLVLALDLGTFGFYQGWRTQLPGQSDLQLAPLTAHLDNPRMLSIPGLPYPYHDIDQTRATLYPQTNVFAGVKAINGFEPLLAANYSRLVGGMTMGGALTQAHVLGPSSRVLDLLQCQTIRLHATLGDTEMADQLKSAPWRLLKSENGAHLYENIRPLARAWRPTALHIAPEADIARWLRGEVPGDTFAEAWLTKPLASTRLFAGSVNVKTPGFNDIRVHTSGKGHGLVVISESHAPGWRAWSENQELPVHRVNGLLLGVEVPAGTHHVRLRYQPQRWPLAAAVSSVCALFWLLAWLRRPKKHPYVELR